MAKKKQQGPTATAGKALAGHVAVVAGATRGAGRGVARALGEAGAIVYCTGRSTTGAPSAYGRPETIDETAAFVTADGGTGVAVRVDHTIEDEVAALFARVEREQGRLDLVVDSVAGEDPGLGGWTPVWKTDLSRGPDALRAALFSHVVTAKHAATIMQKRKRGLLVEVTEGDLLFGGGNVLGELVKTGLKALAVRLAHELRPHRVAAVAVTPGFLRSEAMLQHFGVTEETWRDGGKRDKHFLQSETPRFLGRGVAALAADEQALALSGEILSSWDLARRYQVDDVDGQRPDWGPYFRDIMPSLGGLSAELRRHVTWMEQMTERARYYAGDDPPRGR
jgi:NAD(P)-dependent dehydrogenase (short-subunit alcohol dehydrogenase family)